MHPVNLVSVVEKHLFGGLLNIKNLFIKLFGVIGKVADNLILVDVFLHEQAKIGVLIDLFVFRVVFGYSPLD